MSAAAARCYSRLALFPAPAPHLQPRSALTTLPSGVLVERQFYISSWQPQRCLQSRPTREMQSCSQGRAQHSRLCASATHGSSAILLSRQYKQQAGQSQNPWPEVARMAQRPWPCAGRASWAALGACFYPGACKGTAMTDRLLSLAPAPRSRLHTCTRSRRRA